MDFLIDFFRSSPDWVKAVWVLSLPAFVVSMTALVLWYRVAMQRLHRANPDQPAVSEPEAQGAALSS